MNDIQTRAEMTGYQETSRYPETVQYSKKLQDGSEYIRYSPFGLSPEGRELPLLIASKDRLFDPVEARKSEHLILLVINGIHPGEIAGKEASFALLRDIAVTHAKLELLNRVILLVVPIYNVDGHERFGPYHRINQSGPKEMGWRTNSRNRNLNRDWMKVEEKETKALLALYNRWLPHFVIDNHVSDGADFQYDLTYLLDDNLRVATSLRAYINETLEPQINSEMAKRGHITCRYFELRNNNDPADGVHLGPTTARFSNGYGALRNRPNITVETHMLKTFQQRITAHYDLMEVILRHFDSEGGKLQTAVEQADRDAAQLKGEYPIRLKLNERQSEDFVFRGIEYSQQQSEISGSIRVIYGKQPIEKKTRFFKTMEADRTISIPLGYLIPVQYDFVLECLRNHDIALTLLKREITGEFETYRFKNVIWQKEPFEGHHMADFQSTKTHVRQRFPTGSALVSLNQSQNKLILELLEPDSADSLISWGFFNAIFEDKEYAEAFILEELAEKMLAEDQKLAVEFQNRLKESEEFRRDPASRLRFFYDRSLYADQRKNVYPIARITRKSEIPPDAV